MLTTTVSARLGGVLSLAASAVFLLSHPPAVAQQAAPAAGGYWQLERTESSRREIGGNPCYARDYAGSEDTATLTTRMVCGSTRWTSALTGSWSRPPARLEPGERLEMTVKGSVTASHEGINASGQISVDFEALPCGRTGSGRYIAWVQVESGSRGTRLQEEEQTGIAVVPGPGRQGSRQPTEQRLQLRACMDGWQTYFIYLWTPAAASPAAPVPSAAAPAAPIPNAAAPAADPATSRRVAILRYCRPLVEAALPELQTLAGSIERDIRSLGRWQRREIENEMMWSVMVDAMLNHPAGHMGHPGRLLAEVNQAIGRQDFIAGLSWRCQQQISEIEQEFASSKVDADAYARAHAGEVDEALRAHRAEELAAIGASCERAFEAMMANRRLFESARLEFRWGSRANQEAGYQEACLAWQRRLAQSH